MALFRTKNFCFSRLEIFNQTMSKLFVQGKDLIAAGITPNERFGDCLDYAHKLRLDGGIRTAF